MSRTIKQLDSKTGQFYLLPTGDLSRTSVFVQVQGRRKMEPEEYIEYFKDYILSLTP